MNLDTVYYVEVVMNCQIMNLGIIHPIDLICIHSVTIGQVISLMFLTTKHLHLGSLRMYRTWWLLMLPYQFLQFNSIIDFQFGSSSSRNLLNCVCVKCFQYSSEVGWYDIQWHQGGHWKELNPVVPCFKSRFENRPSSQRFLWFSSALGEFRDKLILKVCDDGA